MKIFVMGESRALSKLRYQMRFIGAYRRLRIGLTIATTTE